MHSLFLILTVFLAAAVEVVEMVTIVVGVGATRGWRATMVGVGAGLFVLAAVIGGLGAALQYVPINVLRAVVGALLLLFGLQWLRKAVLRIGQTGWTARPAEVDEDDEGRGGGRHGFDWTAFALSFKGVVLEGLEVAFVVVAFSAANRQLLLGVIGAAASFVVVGAAGAVARRYLERVPGKALKFAVGILLVSFGSFWGAEGLGVEWPFGDLAILFLVGFYLLIAWTALLLLRERRVATPAFVGNVAPNPDLAGIAGRDLLGADDAKPARRRAERETGVAVPPPPARVASGPPAVGSHFPPQPRLAARHQRADTMMVLRTIYHYLGRFVVFWRDFLIGNDWWGAGIVLLGLGLAYLAVHFGVTAFWVPMLFVTVSLTQNLLRARRPAARAQQQWEEARLRPQGRRSLTDPRLRTRRRH
jgi:uncharacterized membrane protein